MELSKPAILAFLQFIIASYLAVHNLLQSKMVFAAGWAVVAGIGITSTWKFRNPEPLQV